MVVGFSESTSPIEITSPARRSMPALSVPAGQVALPTGRSGEVELLAFLLGHRLLAGGTPPARLHRSATHGMPRGGSAGMPCPPAGQHPQHGRKLAARGGELILKPGRTLRVSAGYQQPVA